MFAFGLGGYEWLVVLVVVLLLFGTRIPSLARSLGSGITEFKKGLKGGGDNQGTTPGGGTPGGHGDQHH
jgi:sec-independent protein translocase protein TatA